MLNFGMGELALLALIALLVVGPERLPLMVRFLGRQYGKLMRASRELRRAFVMEAERVDAEIRSKELKAKREDAKKRLKAQLKKAKEGDSTAPVSQKNDTYIPFDHDPPTQPAQQQEEPNKEESVEESTAIAEEAEEVNVSEEEQ